jgi:hypothetical protein
MDIQPFHIFLASPGDVQDERNLARTVIDQIRHERAFRERVDIKVIAWDHQGEAVAMDAGLTPQEAIKQGLPKPSDCDLVVVILWSRMGTPLPDEYRKADGSPYLSGTEWEYEDAMGATTRPERPAVWVYRRTQVPVIALEDPEFDEKRAQWAKVKSFFERFTHPDGSLGGGINTYETPDVFRGTFERHLRDHLTSLIEKQTPHPAVSPVAKEGPEEAPPRWEGSPYPGLETFSAEQAAIFFGRARETDQLIELLRDPGLRFLAVLGASGSGKSSLVAAGLIPRLRAGALPGSAQWVDIAFKPGERAERDGNCPFLSLSHALKPLLGASGHRPVDLAQELRAEPASFFEMVAQALSGRQPAAELILFVDQFEELFTLVTDTERRAGFIALLKAVVEKPGSRVRTIATMRSDFTERVADTPELAGLFQGKGLFLLSAPGERALAEMILRPARVAGVDVGEALCERILKDTGTGPGALALMAFTLNQLYRHGRTETGALSLDYYEKKLGGVQGAIDRQAEAALAAVKRDHRFDEQALHDLFMDLVEVTDQGVATRRRVSKEVIGQDPAKEILANALVEARVLVTDHETASTCEVAHEAIFTGWQRLSKWIEDNHDAMRVCRNLRVAAMNWRERGSPRFSYLPDVATLKQYRRAHAMFRHEGDAITVQKYLSTARLRFYIVGVALTLTFLFGIVSGINAWRSQKGMSLNALRIWVLLRVGAYRPPMELVPPGCFQMMCKSKENCREDAKEVCLKPFEMGRYEVTRDLYIAVIGSRPKFFPKNGDQQPATGLHWVGTKNFIFKLNQLTGEQYRIPTAAEWEYAARSGGKKETYAGGENLDDLGWYKENSGGRTHQVGQKNPNGLGLYDMSGNAWEKVVPHTDASYKNAQIEAFSPGSPQCGGSYKDDGKYCNTECHFPSANVNLSEVELMIYLNEVGFRLARSVALGP